MILFYACSRCRYHSSLWGKNSRPNRKIGGVQDPRLPGSRRHVKNEPGFAPDIKGGAET